MLNHSRLVDKTLSMSNCCHGFVESFLIFYNAAIVQQGKIGNSGIQK
jgi:hypothetical protein